MVSDCEDPIVTVEGAFSIITKPDGLMRTQTVLVEVRLDELRVGVMVEE